MKAAALAAAAAVSYASLALASVNVNPNGPFPHKTEDGQYGYNDCGSKDSPKANCQTLRVNSVTDFCLWAPPKRATIGDSERYEVAWCTKAGHGARLIPKGTIKGAHYVSTPHYVQITGVGDFTKINIPKGDEGGELDPHGADGNGNPIGALVIANLNGTNTQIKEWHSFISYNEFCIRACKPGPDAARYCQHIYDVMGCYWNDPGNYDAGTFEQCVGDDVAMPPGEYKLKNGQTSTWHQGVSPTPAGQKPPKSYGCKKVKTIPAAAYPTSKAKRHFGSLEH